MIHRAIRRLLLASAVASTSVVASSSFAQYKIDNSQAHDANNRIGSGGFNGSQGANTSNGGLNGNLIVTGNVGNGRSFRGALGYTDASAFRGNLGSASFDNFNRDSVGVAQLRSSAASTYAGQGVTTFQPFFGAGRTVAPPAGFVQNVGGNYVLPRPQFVQASDGRIDYGGATRAQVNRGALAQQTVIGGAGLSNSAFGAFDQGSQLSQPYNVSEFTQLGRPSARIGLLEQNSTNRGTGLDNNVFSNARDPNASGNAGPEAVDRQSNDAAADNRTGLNPNVGNAQSIDPTRQSAGNPTSPYGAGQTGTGQNGSTSGTGSSDATRTGQSIQIRDLRAIQNNPQYAALRGRLDARNAAGNAAGNATGVNASAIEESNRRNQQVLALRAKAATPDANKAGDKSSDAKANATPANAAPADATPDAPTPAATPPAQPDSLRLARPMPEGVPMPMPTPAVAAGPVEIKSLATGVKDAELRKTLGDAETLMKAGKFTSAIDAYDRAQTIATDDPIVFTGRGIAELGGGYYRNAETHFRQAFTADHSLLLARFDLRELLTADRLNFLLDDLGRVANADKTDPGPLVLLAFVYYNTNLPDRAAKALDLAQQRADGKDQVVKLMWENWTLPSDTQDTSGMNK